MGHGDDERSVLVMQQSPPADQGANAAALQISDSTLSVLFIGLGGTVLAAGGGEAADVGTFLIIFVIMAAVGAVAALVAPRVASPGAASASPHRYRDRLVPDVLTRAHAGGARRDRSAGRARGASSWSPTTG